MRIRRFRTSRYYVHATSITRDIRCADIRSYNRTARRAGFARIRARDNNLIAALQLRVCTAFDTRLAP
jgi:hypothetical protein